MWNSKTIKAASFFGCMDLRSGVYCIAALHLFLIVPVIYIAATMSGVTIKTVLLLQRENGEAYFVWLAMLFNSVASFNCILGLYQLKYDKMAMFVTITKIITFYCIYQLICMTANAKDVIKVLTFLPIAMVLGLYSYCTIVVNSLFVNMEEEEKRNRQTLNNFRVIHVPYNAGSSQQA